MLFGDALPWPCLLQVCYAFLQASWCIELICPVAIVLLFCGKVADECGGVLTSLG